MTDTTQGEYDKISRITDSLNREVLSTLPVAVDKGGVQPNFYNQLLDISKTMSTAKYIPPHLRGSPGDCLMIRELALEHGLSAYGLAVHSYVVNGIISQDGQAVNAIILKSARTEERPRYTFDGEGDEMTCTVTATFLKRDGKPESQPCVYTTPPMGQINPKNSPLWKTDPQQQLCYLAIRRWAKRHCPDIILGVFGKDELEDNPNIGFDNAKDVSPNLAERLPAKLEGTKGFAENIVDVGLKREAILTEQLKQSVAAEQAARATGDAAGEATAEGVGKVAPQAEQAAQKPPPATPGEYQVHAMAWIDKVNDPDDLEARWDGEKEMRAALGIPVAMRKMLEGGLRAKLNQLRKPKK